MSQPTTSFSPVIIKGLLLVLTEGVLAFLLLSFLSFADYLVEKEIPKIEVNKADLDLRPGLGKWYYQGKAFSGYAVAYFPNGCLESRLGYWEGKKEGLAQKWYSNEQLRTQAYYRSNHLDGTVRAWTAKGILVKEAYYVDGQTHGLQKQWYANGQLFKETRYHMGQEEGLQRAWRENGALFINYEAKHGRFFGMKRANACYELKDEMVQF